ncbi:MaoC/PaaZ C-terminal domain-containing protein [Nocardia aobensis]|uniref:MaoC/PaaZ C-terminal domain-containing protein n=1 Tax=Nocardia aobensis TaxID=257277 RepID=UPI000A0467DA
MRRWTSLSPSRERSTSGRRGNCARHRVIAACRDIRSARNEHRAGGSARLAGWISLCPKLIRKSLLAALCCGGRSIGDSAVFGSTIAHGYLTPALCNLFLPQLISVQNVSMAMNYGANRVRFPAPVRAGSRVRGSGEILACTDVPGGVQSAIRVTVEIEGSAKPACVVDKLSRWIE